MARKKSSAPKPKPINKKELVSRLVDIPKNGVREFLMREYAVLKRLEQKYPLEFLNIVRLPKKLESLIILDSEWGHKELDKKFFAFNYKEKAAEVFELSEKKFGEDVNIERNTLRKIL